jgi:hypothetical protein
VFNYTANSTHAYLLVWDRETAESDGIHTLCEPAVSYASRFEEEKAPLKTNNTHFWSDRFDATSI